MVFAHFEAEEMSKERESEITGYHRNESLAAVIECDQKLWTMTFAAGGLDN